MSGFVLCLAAELSARILQTVSRFVLCVAVESTRILQAVSKFVSFVAGEKCTYGDVCPL